MPLGKLSGNQIKDAYDILRKLQDYVSDKNEVIDQKTVMTYSNKFYTLIPHNFTTAEAPVLDSIPAIKVGTYSRPV